MDVAGPHLSGSGPAPGRRTGTTHGPAHPCLEPWAVRILRGPPCRPATPQSMPGGPVPTVRSGGHAAEADQAAGQLDLTHVTEILLGKRIPAFGGVQQGDAVKDRPPGRCRCWRSARERPGDHHPGQLGRVEPRQPRLDPSKTAPMYSWTVVRRSLVDHLVDVPCLPWSAMAGSDLGRQRVVPDRRRPGS